MGTILTVLVLMAMIALGTLVNHASGAVGRLWPRRRS
ncbi:hypothetical protein FBY35_0707 [Streptomyces sp. SLBN-118]|nr:hypothetical protein FBY35_0707 [Streptomyces sp. SLBN-118]